MSNALELTGFLVRRKRASTRAPVLSCELAALWTPLLSRLEEAHEGFIEGLLLRMIDILGTSEEPSEWAWYRLIHNAQS